MSYFETLFEKGVTRVCDKNVVICGIVRDCGHQIKHNIPIIETIASYFNDYRIIVFENNSKDNTKSVLREWSCKNKKVVVRLVDVDESKYKSIEIDYSSIPHFRRSKIQKYVDFRNCLLDFVQEVNFDSDYSIVVDLDVARINSKGVLTSFGTEFHWDAMTANGYSYSVSLKRRYHDSYPLCECGLEKQLQTSQVLYENRTVFGRIRRGMPFVKVYSAFGGMAIYRSAAIQGLRYQLINNDFEGIQVRCEHFSLYKQMAENGCGEVFINPNMEILYQRINIKSIWRFLGNRVRAVIESRKYANRK